MNAHQCVWTLAALLTPLVPAALSAQQRLIDVRALSSGVVAEHWSFNGGTPTGGGAAVTGASQFTVPVTAVVPLSRSWALDAYMAYAHGTVTVDRGGTRRREELSLSGVNDAKLRLVGKLKGDNVLLTLGASLPSGATALNGSQLEALGVLAAPALRFRTPVLGTGTSGTGGLVVASQAGSWSLAAAASYEVRGNYAPSAALGAGVARASLRAGNALHLSLGADRVDDVARQSLSVIADLFSGGELSDPQQSTTPLNFRLGPAFTGTYQVQTTTRNVESMFFLLERLRTNYTLAGAAVAGSWRSETEAGVVNAVPLSPGVSARIGLDGRFHTAPTAASPDQSTASFASAGILAGGATLGVQYAARHGSFLLEPFVRGQVGQLDFAGPVRRATGASAGATLTVRF